MKNNLIGVWKLVRFEFNAEDGRTKYPFGKEARGSFIYTKSNRFSVQLMRIDRPRFAISDQLRGSIEETEASYRGCISYFGTYKVDEENKMITHQVEGSLFPNMEGTEQIRYYELEENNLILRTPSFNADGVRVHGIIVWERVE